MKKSIYNHLSFIDGNWVLYNAFTEELSILDPEVKRIYDEHDINEIDKIHHDFYQYLLEKNFIVPISKVESDSCIEEWKKEDDDPSVFSLTINPTLDCNMKCWYCYEQHQASKTMTPDMVERICKCIKMKMQNQHLEQFNLAFFGGEPLLQFNKIVKPISEFAYQQAMIYKKSLAISFTTNGYLLSSKVIDFLSSLNIPISFQITLDGNEYMHNKTRYIANGIGSYKKILENSKNILAHPQFNIFFRCNYTTTNIATFIDLSDDLEENGILPSEHLHISFHRVWQDHGNETEVGEHLEKVYKLLVNAGYDVADIHAHTKYRCYAERNNHIVINYDGNLFRCTARDFLAESSEGNINDDGTLSFNEKSSLREKLKWGTEDCLQCSIYPLCNGLCSQQKFEYKYVTGCIAGYSKEQKVSIINQRIRTLIDKVNEGK